MPLREHDGHSNVSLRFLFNEEVVARPARSVVGSQPAGVRSFRNCRSYRDLPCLKPCLFLGWHIASEGLLQEYTGLAISTQLRTIPKGYSHSKTPVGSAEAAVGPASQIDFSAQSFFRLFHYTVIEP